MSTLLLLNLPWLTVCTAVQGEDQKKLDILANEVFINMLSNSGQCSVLVGLLSRELMVSQFAVDFTDHDMCQCFASCEIPDLALYATHLPFACLQGKLYSGIAVVRCAFTVQVSEENDEPIIIEEGRRGQYCVVMDPLDGSSNIDCGVSIGTIFGIYKAQQGSRGTVEDVLRVCTSCYCLALSGYHNSFCCDVQV